MKLFKVYLVFTLLLASFLALADQECSSLESCVHKVSEITNKNNFWKKEQDMKSQIKHTKNFKLTFGNADRFISELLLNHHLARVESSEGYFITHARDIRYYPLPEYSTEEVENLPNSYDYISVSLPFKHDFQSKNISKGARHNMSRYGRIVTNHIDRTVSIHETVNNAKRVIKLIKSLEREYTPEEVKKFNKQVHSKKQKGKL